MTESYAKVNGIKICYEISGEKNKQSVILVHGFGSKKESWIAQNGVLSKDFKVIRFDNRGAGRSERPKGPYTMDNFADDIRALMDYLKINKTAIIGWSLGGMIVQHFLLKYPQGITKAILIHTNYKGVGGHLYKKLKHQELDLLLEDPETAFWNGTKLGYLPKFRKQMQENPKKLFYGSWSVEQQIKDSITDPPTHNDIDNQAAALDTHNTLERLHEIKVPTLLIAASHDRLTPKSTMVEMQERMPNSKLITIENAGHSAPLSNTLEVNEAIIAFLKE
jgi:pimeloyl-ACP methyl ester carboxylesterase